MRSWPDEADWAGLKQEVGGRLALVRTPDLADPNLRKLIRDPFYLGGQPGLSESSGWVDAWRAAPSAYVVAAENVADVAAAISFARAHRVRIVVRGGGHSYLGTSAAPDSLMIWTRRMNAIKVHDAFTPTGSKAAPVPSVSAGAGCVWLHLYQAVTGGAGRYVQGGGCTTVGITGLLLGGGFGSFSKRYGLAAASLLAERHDRTPAWPRQCCRKADWKCVSHDFGILWVRGANWHNDAPGCDAAATAATKRIGGELRIRRRTDLAPRVLTASTEQGGVAACSPDRLKYRVPPSRMLQIEPQKGPP